MVKIEDAEIRTQQMSKRLRKLDGLRSEIGSPRIHQVPKADFTLIGWGSTYGAIKEASSLLENDGVAANIVHLNEIWPFPAALVSLVLNKGAKNIVIENNATAQLARLIRRETGQGVDGSILKFDGRPFSPQYIIDKLKKEVS
jgi:2-oxoglutarate ferredoxin oxidoreductase subunit alpha